MSLFHSTNTTVRYGVVIEIGSGSVLVSIIKSDQALLHPDCIWSKREYAPRRTESNLVMSAKNVMTSLMNAMLLVESEGKKVLKEHDPAAHLYHIQVSISAPWSYTITKVINYTEEAAFTITNGLLQGLMDAAQKKITEELHENELATDLGLTIMTRATTDIQVNGYKIANPVGQTGESVTLTQVSAVAQAYLTESISDLQEKILPKATVERFSFMLMFHCIIRDLHHQMTEYCLIDITDEATEIGIVRDGILRYCTHTITGTSSLARSIAEALAIPIDEAHALLSEPYHTRALATLTGPRLEKLTAIFTEYRKAITALLHETGDTLSIPKTVFLHGGSQAEDFFCRQIEQAAKDATNSTHTVHRVTAELITADYTTDDAKTELNPAVDTALLVAAQFFHKQHHCNDFIQV